MSALFDFTILTARAGEGMGAARGMDGIVGKGRELLRGLIGLAGFCWYVFGDGGGVGGRVFYV